MKRIIAGFILIISGNCQAQFKVSDASLKIDTTLLITVCDCNDALISQMKEVISILEEMKRLQKKGSKISELEEEIRKRDVKHYEFYIHCKPIYNLNRYEVKNCLNYAEGEELDKKINALRKELGMY